LLEDNEANAANLKEEGFPDRWMLLLRPDNYIAFIFGDARASGDGALPRRKILSATFVTDGAPVCPMELLPASPLPRCAICPRFMTGRLLAIYTQILIEKSLELCYFVLYFVIQSTF